MTETITQLYHSAYSRPWQDGTMSAMEAVACLAGEPEPWSDHPRTACPVLSAFMRTWNDELSDADRTELLLPLVPLLVGTRGSRKQEQRRANMAADWLIRVYTPAWLRLAKLDAQADILESPLVRLSEVARPSLLPLLEGVRKDADAGAWSACAWDSTWSAAGEAAWDAAGEAGAWDAEIDAARVIAANATWIAAGIADADAINKTCREIQTSAVDLVKRMIGA